MYTKVCSVCQVEKMIDDFENRNNKPTYRCKECLSIYHKQYYLKNKDKLKNKTSDFRKNNAEYMKNWRKNNIEKIKMQKTNWYNENRDEINRNERSRRQTDIQYKIKKNLRRRVNQLITRNNRSDSTMGLIGCSIYELLQYLENKFSDGMSWANYGSWHIDHIIPCVGFDLTDIEQQKKCFHYSNLQPLWAKDNISKGCKLLY